MYQCLLEVAKGAKAVSEKEFNLFKRAMGEQGESHSSTQAVIAAAAKSQKKGLDAWGASGGMPRV
eukprot:CAMPEP_0173381558 /NCGR_PEP_ID=MMETSP1356-20130122/3941_1 /TAXON_ID=77927 ORGANISM="Hemiselmis virescens, Strain PCC157" /NCGR_SAMPLE_ID=MMETSP1356 /ASSEMBLY_ACC=CAM_ASM_000847 /LENGTH=64 /DNA_ID=CAMNT_0014335419 /DNA_START=19 /DNA_END=213 /DNA_ORIENTATION=+